MSLTNQKHLFDLPEDVTYLNIASLSPSFKSIEEAGLRAVKEKSRPYLIPSSDFFNPVTELKKLFAQLINVNDYNRIANIPSVSYGLATIAHNISLKENSEIVLIEEQFPSNYYVWEKLAKKYNAKLKIVQQEINGKLWNEAILNAINVNTGLIALGNIHWANGTIFDLKAIRKKTRQHDALLIIDGSQSIGALPFSVKEIQPDAMVCAGYKWLFGPYGCGYAYFGSYFDNGNPIEENWANRLGSENLTNLTNYESNYKALANRYSVGEHGSFIYIQMQIAAITQLLKWKASDIQDYCHKITVSSVNQLKKAGCEIEEDTYRAKHLFGIKLPESVNKKALKEKLTREKIFVSFRGDYIRISCHLYNTEAHFEKLTKCILSEIEI
ncbi:aminotransferase class V-fold PLP-dependent enzyme [Tenacibaculum jejuense]|uniref:Aminotransferase class-V n=1 Tax=Tenacibaculum jejuense TaxID=584609 RepID=A0A238UB32_9FLAO|nr:aminotransferase class V-fold PLP-dependent enzyme [Tenacibaculum jejuense]SNR16413.1 Aminotransferase class-V [Tenacibaculum jejuense]